MRIPNKFNGYSADGIRLYNDPVTAAAIAAGAGQLGAAAAAAAPTIAATTAAALPAAVPLAATAAVPAAFSSAIPGLISQAAPALAGQAAMTAPSVIPGLIGGASPVFSAAANPLTTAMSNGMNFPLTPGGIPAAQPSFFDSFKGFAKENPMLTQMGFSTAQDVLTPDQMPSPAPVVPVQARGQLRPYDPMAAMNPYLQTVVGGGQPISLI
jgi:hypothetical protein